MVATSGIVTARKTNGFFIQSPDVHGWRPADIGRHLRFHEHRAGSDADAGTMVSVTGRVIEFVPAADR